MRPILPAAVDSTAPTAAYDKISTPELAPYSPKFKRRERCPLALTGPSATLKLPIFGIYVTSTTRAGREEAGYSSYPLPFPDSLNLEAVPV